MQFLKNHYEKVVLSLVLLLLAVAVFLLPERVSPVDDAAVPPSNKPVEAVNLSTNEQTLSNLQGLASVQLDGDHNTFNPVLWRRKADGSLWKITSLNEIGAGAVRILKTNSPLYFMLSYEGVNPPNYQVGVTQETNKNVNLRGKVPKYARVGEKTEFFKILKVVGQPESPEGLVLEVNEVKDPVTISREIPYKAVAGYTADLAYSPQNLTWRERRTGDALVFEGETNNIVDISADEVVLSASSGKRTTIKYNAAP